MLLWADIALTTEKTFIKEEKPKEFKSTKNIPKKSKGFGHKTTE